MLLFDANTRCDLLSARTGKNHVAKRTTVYSIITSRQHLLVTQAVQLTLIEVTTAASINQ